MVQSVLKADSDSKISSLKLMKELLGAKFEVKEFCNEWILVTYDLPNTLEGNRARLEFFRKARRIGAVPHTESVYLLPWTPEAELAAVDLSDKGTLFLWVSRARNEIEALGVTRQYDMQIKKQITELETRVIKMEDYLENGKDGLANRMLEKTLDITKALQEIIVRRGSADLFEDYEPLVSRVWELHKQLN